MVLFLMLSGTYYAKNYIGIIGLGQKGWLNGQPNTTHFEVASTTM